MWVAVQAQHVALTALLLKFVLDARKQLRMLLSGEPHPAIQPRAHSLLERDHEGFPGRRHAKVLDFEDVRAGTLLRPSHNDPNELSSRAQRARAAAAIGQGEAGVCARHSQMTFTPHEECGRRKRSRFVPAPKV